MKRIRVIDSHTGGEPTRVVVEGGPDLGTGPMAERRVRFRDRFDPFRSAVVNEPRGSDALVGALLCEPCQADCAAGVIFFNNVGYLGMCGHGAIGVVATLGHLGRIRPGRHRLETPAGAIEADLHASGAVTIQNVASYRWAKGVALNPEGYGRLTGEVAWGGNWFFLSDDHGLQLSPENIDRLLDCTWKIRRELRNRGITGKDRREIDHIALFAPPQRTDADARNFVLCPGGSYDRSPCGTGTSARVACLVADGRFGPGQTWRQESITGSLFEATVRLDQGRIVPSIKGSAFVTAEATLLLDPLDPMRMGLKPAFLTGTLPPS